MAKKKPLGKHPSSTQPMLDKYGETLIEKVVTADGPGTAGAAAHLYRTLVEWAFAKPPQKVDVTGYSGFKIVDVE